MTKTKIGVAAAALTFGIGLIGPPARAGEDVKLEDISAKAKEAIRTAVGNGEIEEIERDEEQGRTIYEVEYQRDGEDYEMKVTEDGRVLENEKD